MFKFLKLRKPNEFKTEVKNMIFKVEYSHTYTNNLGMPCDMYLLYWNSKTEEMITLAIPHGRQDIAQFIQEKLNASQS